MEIEQDEVVKEEEEEKRWWWRKSRRKMIFKSKENWIARRNFDGAPEAMVRPPSITKGGGALWSRTETSNHSLSH